MEEQCGESLHVLENGWPQEYPPDYGAQFQYVWSHIQVKQHFFPPKIFIYIYTHTFLFIYLFSSNHKQLESHRNVLVKGGQKEY